MQVSDLVLTSKNLLFPIFCEVCGVRLLTEENGYFCPTCWELSPRVTRPFCTVCGSPHRGALGFGTRSNFLCQECRTRTATQRRKSYGRIFGAALYDGAVKEAIHLFKFYDKIRLARPLGKLMAEFAQQEMECGRYDYIVPVPLYRVRKRERGYNQSLLLADEVSHVFPNATVSQPIDRIRPTRTQSSLKSESERRKNVQGAFAVNENAHLKGKVVLLVDDVVTTGGTASECAVRLRRAGAADVDVLCVALAAKAPQ